MNYSKVQSSNKDKEMVTIAEEELAKLRRQLRIMEDDRFSFLEETSVKLEKQRKMIANLMEEKNKIVDENSTATCKNQIKSDQKLSNIVMKLLQEFEQFDASARNEKDQLEELEHQIKKMTDNVHNVRPKAVITDQDYKNRLNSGYKSIHILKSRLDIAIKRFSFILSENKKLREDINHLLNERKNFNVMWDKLLKMAHADKKIMAEWIERATAAFDQREDWCSKLVALRRRAQNDFLSHSEEMRDIQRKLDHDLTLREFLSVKGQIRILKDLEENEKKKREEQVQNLEKQLLNYEQTMEEIQNFCVEDNVHQIASRFLKQDEENFALFNYVNELNHEIEILLQSLMEIEEKIDNQLGKQQIRMDEIKDNVENNEKGEDDFKTKSDNMK